MVIRKWEGVVRTKRQGGVLAGICISHHHHHSAWQRTVLLRWYRDRDVGDRLGDWGVQGYWGSRDGRNNIKYIFGRLCS